MTSPNKSRPCSRFLTLLSRFIDTTSVRHTLRIRFHTKRIRGIAMTKPSSTMASRIPTALLRRSAGTSTHRHQTHSHPAASTERVNFPKSPALGSTTLVSTVKISTESIMTCSSSCPALLIPPSSPTVSRTMSLRLKLLARLWKACSQPLRTPKCQSQFNLPPSTRWNQATLALQRRLFTQPIALEVKTPVGQHISTSRYHSSPP